MFKRIFLLMLNDPLKLPMHIWEKFFISWISKKDNIEIKGRLKINGIPLIDIRKRSGLIIEDKVSLNSRNKGYHINMHSPVKIFADKPGAIIRIGEKTRVHGSCIHACRLVEIGRNCLIAANCQIFDANGHALSFSDSENRINTVGEGRPVVIEDNVWIGANSIVLPGVTIGQGSVISASSVVAHDVPSMVVAGGNPAVVIKDYSGIST